MIDVYSRQRHLGPGLAAIGASIDVCLRRPDRLRIVSVDKNLVVVTGIPATVPVVSGRAAPLGLFANGRGAAASPGLHLLADSRPRGARVVRSEESPLAFLSGDERVDDSGVPPVDSEADASHLDRRQAFRQLGPGGAAVGGFVEPAF